MGVRRRLPAAPRLGPTVLALLVAAVTAAGCGGSGPPRETVDSREPGGQSITVWIIEDEHVAAGAREHVRGGQTADRPAGDEDPRRGRSLHETRA